MTDLNRVASRWRELVAALRGDRRNWLAMVLGLAGAAAVLAALVGPWRAPMLDLSVYRFGADALLRGEDVYQVLQPGTGLAFTYPMFAAVIFVPYALMPERLAEGLTVASSLLALWVLVYLTMRYAWRRAQPARVLRWSVLVTLLATTVHPVLDTLLFGQVNLVIAAAVALDLLVLPSRHRGFLAGLATGVKLVSGLFILYYLATGQVRAARNALLGFTATVALGFVVSPGPAWDFWTRHMFDADRVGGIAYVTNQSILGMSARLLRDPHPPGVLTLSLSAVVAIAALLAARTAHRAGDELAAMCVVAVGSLLASPISWSHHWVWLIPIGGLLVDRVRGAGGWWRWGVLGIVFAIGWLGPMRFTPKTGLRELHHTLPQQLVANCYGLLAVAFLVWIAWYGYRRRAVAVPESTQPVGAPPPVPSADRQVKGAAGLPR